MDSLPCAGWNIVPALIGKDTGFSGRNHAAFYGGGLQLFFELWIIIQNHSRKSHDQENPADGFLWRDCLRSVFIYAIPEPRRHD